MIRDKIYKLLKTHGVLKYIIERDKLFMICVNQLDIIIPYFLMLIFCKRHCINSDIKYLSEKVKNGLISIVDTSLGVNNKKNRRNIIKKALNGSELYDENNIKENILFTFKTYGIFLSEYELGKQIKLFLEIENDFIDVCSIYENYDGVEKLFRKYEC